MGKGGGRAEREGRGGGIKGREVERGQGREDKEDKGLICHTIKLHLMKTKTKGRKYEDKGLISHRMKLNQLKTKMVKSNTSRTTLATKDKNDNED